MAAFPSLAAFQKTENVTIGGVTFTVRALRSGESRAVQEAFDTIAPPLIKDPNKGSAAASIENYSDPGFVKRDRERSDLVSSAWFAVATGYPHDGKTFDQVVADNRAAWLQGAAKALEGELPDAVKAAVVSKSRSMFKMAEAVDAAVGNSSAPSPPPAAAAGA